MTLSTPEVAADRRQANRIDWEAALSEHARWLRTVVVARVRDPHAVDEVMQDVALAAVEAAAPIAEGGRLAPWLYRVAVVQCVRYWRADGRRRRKLNRYADRCDHDGNGRAADATIDPIRLLLAEERRQTVERALANLAGRDAEILLLKYTEHWSCRQLSEHLGIGAAAVDGRLQRARERLRRELARLGLSEEFS